jgi:hypothetical protein
VYQSKILQLIHRIREQARSHNVFPVLSVTALEIHFPAQRFLPLIRP